MPRPALLFPADICQGGTNVTNATCPGDVTGAHNVEYNDMITGGVAATCASPSRRSSSPRRTATRSRARSATRARSASRRSAASRSTSSRTATCCSRGGIGPVAQHQLRRRPRACSASSSSRRSATATATATRTTSTSARTSRKTSTTSRTRTAAPSRTTISDGILDVDDECPLVPEDHDGDEDEDGCPEGNDGDRDGDGILDNVDKCPDDPEDRDGFQDEDGCPDPGQRQGRHPRRRRPVPERPRGQGRLRGRGRLPRSGQRQGPHPRRRRHVPERPRDLQRLRGRGRLPRPRQRHHRGERDLILEKIYFETDSAEILPRSFPIVDAVAATLIGNPQITLIEVQGHADERGADDYNLRLTADRAAVGRAGARPARRGPAPPAQRRLRRALPGRPGPQRDGLGQEPPRRVQDHPDR